MIAVGYCRVVEWDSYALSHFPFTRREMLSRITHAGRLNESVTVTMLLLRMLESAAWCDRPVEYDLRGYTPTVALPDWPLGEHGKPFPEGLLHSGERLHVSLSHGGGLAAVALCHAPVGLDIQTAEGFPAAVAARYGWDAADAPRLWAAGEAAIKLRGGTIADMGRIDFDGIALRSYDIGGCCLAVATHT